VREALEQMQFVAAVQLDEMRGDADELSAGPVVRHVANFGAPVAHRFLHTPLLTWYVGFAGAAFSNSAKQCRVTGAPTGSGRARGRFRTNKPRSRPPSEWKKRRAHPPVAIDCLAHGTGIMNYVLTSEPASITPLARTQNECQPEATLPLSRHQAAHCRTESKLARRP
jgi:hypothetical protein